MIETILIAIQAKLNKTSFHATEKNSQKVFISKAYCYRHITNLTFIKKNMCQKSIMSTSMPINMV